MRLIEIEKKTQIIDIRNETESSQQILHLFKRQARQHYKYFSYHKSNSLEDTHQFFENHKLPRLNEDEINNLTSLTRTKKLNF